MADAPAEREPLVAMLERRLGGPVGQHARRAGSWFTAGPWALLIATISWLLLIGRQLPCRQTDAGKPVNAFYRLCYSDISVLYQNRHLEQGHSPYAMEYPVLTGLFVDVSRAVSRLLGAPMGPSVPAQGVLDGANIFFAVNAVGLFACFLVLVWAQLLTTRHRPFDALMVAGAPVLIAAGLINWDLLVVALTACGVLAWSRRREGMAGVFFGLGVAAKLYPALLFVPLFLLALRTGRWRGFGKAVLGAAVAWLVPNGLVYLRSPQDWLYFWTFNVDRAGDLGSIWYVLGLMGAKLGSVSLLQAVLMVLGALALAALALLAPRRPRFAQLAFLMIVWFLIVNKVYSPQYVLWLLPFVVLARPRWQDWLVWTVGELLYFAAVWGHLAGTMFAADSRQDRIYWVAVFVRIGVQLWLAIQVVMDVLHPDEDPLRADGADDPHGGALDGAPDSPWATRLRASVLGPTATAAPAVLAAEAAAPTTAAHLGRDAPAHRRPTPRTGSTVTTGGRWRADSPLSFITQTWLVSRALLVATAVAAMMLGGRRRLPAVIGNWDVEHFTGIAAQGYQIVKDVAFFPGLPMLLRGAKAIGIPYTVSGLAISAVCSFLAVLALHRLGGRSAGPWAAALWLVAPTAVFTFVPYTESLFCALAFWAWQRARAGRWWQMALLAAAACTVRVSGLFLIGALVILILTRRADDTSRELVDARPRPFERMSLAHRAVPLAWLVLPSLVLAAYAWFGQQRFGTWNAWYQAQTEGWNREFHWPWESFLNTLPVIVPGGYADHPGWAWIFRGEVISMAVGTVVVVVCLRRRWWAEASWVAVQVLAFSLSYWWMSVNRAVLLWFPLWLLLGRWVARRELNPARRRYRAFLGGIAVGVSVLVMCLWAYLFYIGWWAS